MASRRKRRKLEVFEDESGDSGSESVRFKCKKCSQTFGLEKKLKYRVKLHHSSKLDCYPYPQCNKTYTTPFNLIIHMKDLHDISDLNSEDNSN